VNDFFKQVCTSIISLLLVAAILSPAIIMLSHALYEHEEQVCEEIGTVHVHEVEIDCDFQKFKLSPQHYPNFAKTIKVHPKMIREKGFNYYSFLSKYQKLHFTLRGPPISLRFPIYKISIHF